MLSLNESVCLCIPIFPGKCGRPLKGTRRSVAKMTCSSIFCKEAWHSTEGQRKPSGPSSSPLWEQGPWSWSHGVGVYTRALSQAGYLQASLIGPSFHSCEVGIIIVPLGLLCGLSEIHEFTQ